MNAILDVETADRRECSLVFSVSFFSTFIVFGGAGV
jgi:hypothetical protein